MVPQVLSDPSCHKLGVLSALPWSWDLMKVWICGGFRDWSPRDSTTLWLYLMVRSILAALRCYEVIKEGSMFVDSREAEQVCVKVPRSKREHLLVFYLLCVIKGALPCRPCWARASNSVEMKFQPSVCLISPAQWIRSSLCLCLISPFVVKRHTRLSDSGKPLWQFLSDVEEVNWGACLGWRHKTAHAFTVTAGFAIFYVLLIYAYSFLFQHIKKNMPSQTFPSLSLPINPGATQVFNFPICEHNWKLAGAAVWGENEQWCTRATEDRDSIHEGEVGGEGKDMGVISSIFAAWELWLLVSVLSLALFMSEPVPIVFASTWNTLFSPPLHPISLHTPSYF